MHNLKEIRKNFSNFEKSLEKRSLKIDFNNLQKLDEQNRDLIQNEVIEYVSSSWNASNYDDVKCKRDTGYIIDAAITERYPPAQWR